jgi:hypothetical protein
MTLDTAQSKPIAFEGPVQGPTIGDNNKVDNYFDNRTIVLHVDGNERSVPFLAPCLPSDYSIVGHEQMLNEPGTGGAPRRRQDDACHRSGK